MVEDFRQYYSKSKGHNSPVGPIAVLLPRSSSAGIEYISQINMRWECKPYKLAGILVTQANKMG